MSSDAVSPLRQRMIEDMNSRKLGAHTQKSHIYSCKRFAAFLQRSPDTATAEDIRLFQLHLAETAVSIGNRNRIMTGVRFLFRVTLRRLDLAAEIYHIREPQKIPLVMSADETRRLLAVASSLKARVLLSLGYGCGLRAGEVVRLKVKHIDSAQRIIRVEQAKIIRVEQAKGRKDRHVMLSPETLDLLREWWTVRPWRYDAGTPLQERWLFPGNRAGKPMTNRQLSRQALLGHDKLDTTARYTRVATGMIASIESPLDLLSQPARQPTKFSPPSKLDIRRHLWNLTANVLDRHVPDQTSCRTARTDPAGLGHLGPASSRRADLPRGGTDSGPPAGGGQELGLPAAEARSRQTCHLSLRYDGDRLFA